MLKQRLGTALLTFLLIISVVFSLSACRNEIPSEVLSKEEIVANISSAEEKDYKYAVDYYSEWGIPIDGIFYYPKVKSVEDIYAESYYKSSKLPGAFEMAKATANLFLEHFYDKIDLTDEKELTDAVISCYVEAVGDDYSVYRTAVEDDEYTTDMSGNFTGIGVVVTYNQIDDTITVNEVYIDSGAEDAGILPGDIITKVDGTPVTEIGYNKTINAVRGEAGTRVNITVDRNGTELTFSVERKLVVEQSVRYSVDENKIAYVRITSFKGNTFDQFKVAIDEIEKLGAKGVIYDLRSNSGGYLSAVVSMLSYIAPKDTQIVSFSNNYASPIYSPYSHVYNIPTVVLCNEYTASAGELFTSAIRDFETMGCLDKVTIIGKTTFGKGIMQSTAAFTDGSSITLTVAYYNPPSGENYHGVGITPDIEVELTEDADSQLDAAYIEIEKLIN